MSADLAAVPPMPPVSYRAEVTSVFETLSEGLAPLVETRMEAAFPTQDWISMASAKLGKRRDVLVSVADPHFQLEVVARWWGPAFSPVLDDDDRADRDQAAHSPKPLGPSRSGSPLRPGVRPGRAS